ncbi:MAG: hypothetical protein Q7K11_01180 [Candidatus Berkelbacteria bacterium]|nr:hypothetical protein [Candidatus Berkelbacteria bacterium]
MREIEYYVVSVSGNGGNHMTDIGKSLHNIGLDDAVITRVDPSILPDDLLRTPSHKVFEDAFKRILATPENKYHPVIHALKEGGGRATRSGIKNRGVSEEIIDATLSALQGHITNDPDDPDNQDKLYCELLLKKSSEKVVFKA